MPKRKPSFVLVWSNGTLMEQDIERGFAVPEWWDEACNAALQSFNEIADRKTRTSYIVSEEAPNAV